MQPVVSIENLSITFTGRTVVRALTFAIGQGEKLALVGESGSGKSVTALSILRLLDPRRVSYPTGCIQFANRDLLRLPDAELRQVRGKHIGMIFQEPMSSLNPVLTIGEQLVEPLMRHEGAKRSVARQRMIELLDRTGIREPHKRFDSYPHMLSGGQRQRVMIAMALACRPQLLLADEPTTALDVTVQAQILELLDELHRELGMSVLLISHDLNLVRRFAQRVCVMKEGELVEQASTAELFRNPQHPYTRHLLASEPERLVRPLADPAVAPLLTGRKLACTFRLSRSLWRRGGGVIDAVADVDIAVRPGETVGVVGESGSGKSTLGLCLLQLQECGGEIVFLGQRLDQLRSKQINPLRKHFQVVFQDPYASLHPRRTVEQIVGEGLVIHQPQLNADERRARVIKVLQEVGLDAAALARYPHEFSGGQRQRIAIARAVILEPKLIVLDEPTSALDASVQKQVLALLDGLQQRRGMSYLFISHDLRVIRAMCHRTVVMRGGRIVEQGDTDTLFSQPRHPYTRELLRAALLASPGVEGAQAEQ